jgi:hypothetical protein
MNELTTSSYQERNSNKKVHIRLPVYIVCLRTEYDYKDKSARLRRQYIIILFERTAGDINSENAPYRHVRSDTESTRMYVFTKSLERRILERETREGNSFEPT